MIYSGKTLLGLSPIRDMLDRKVRENGVSHGLSEAGYDIRIAETVEFIPPVPYREARLLVNGEVQIIGDRFCLASSLEHFQMPNFLVGEVKDKSTWARQGLSVFNTVIEPGWHGWLTLELVFHANRHVKIPAGSGIAQVLFYGITDETAYNGKYQNQGQGPQGPIFEE